MQPFQDGNSDNGARLLDCSTQGCILLQCQVRAQLADAGWLQNPVHRARQPLGERLLQSFNGKLRDELLNGEIFYSLKEAQIVIEQWRKHYNTIRPHWALNYRPPAPQTFAPLDHHLDAIMPMQ